MHTNNLILDSLLSNAAHLGNLHTNINNNSYLYGTRQSYSIINLNHTLTMLKAALIFTKKVIESKGRIMFIDSFGSNKDQLISKMGHTIIAKWQRGLLTNNLVNRPDIIIIFRHVTIVLPELSKMYIPSVAIIDTDIDSSMISYPIISNDDSEHLIYIYKRLFYDMVTNINIMPTNVNY